MNSLNYSMIVAIAVFPAADQKTNTSKPPRKRVVQFPKDRTLGKLSLVDGPIKSSSKAKELGPATGNVTVPAGNRLMLLYSDSRQRDNTPVDLSPLDNLGPNDLQGLAIPFTKITGREVRRLTRHKSLSFLSLGPLSTVNDDALAPLAKMPWLQALSVPETKVTDKGIRYLQKLTKMRNLTLYATGITDRGMKHLAGMKQLRVLQLGKTGITDAGLKHLSSLNQLQHLQLWDTKVGGPGLVHLKSLTKLKTLNLIGTGVSNADLAHLKPLTKLRRLDLSGTNIDDGAVEHLATIKSLRTLLIARTKITPAGTRELKKRLPDCTISR